MNKKDKKKEKQERLARALRDNLKRRKQQPSDKPKANAPEDKGKE